MSDEAGYTRGYSRAGVVHKGEFVVPPPYDYPRWWVRIRKYVRPLRLRGFLNRKIGTYRPDKDLLRIMTGKSFYERDSWESAE